RLPGDETGDCYMFTRKLAELTAETVRYRFGETILEILSDGRKVTGVRTSSGRIEADAVVVALGSYSPAMVKPFGLHLPVFPVKGYSLTIPIENADGAPVSTVMDETYKIAITRLGDRVRVGGTAEVAGFDLSLRQSRRAPLEHSVSDLFGTAGRVEKADLWC